ncbi:MAG: hypothetical protein K2X46_21065 [Roseomonas sp.]|nr:hypothetical protein [Roseomonas sp.]
MVSRTDAMGNMDVLHLDGLFFQQPRAGLVPLTIGSGESALTPMRPGHPRPGRLACQNR